MQRFDFDPEAVVRLAWRGVPFIHLPTPVRYFSKADGGISHFNYLRDNLLLIGMHLSLSVAAIRRFSCFDSVSGMLRRRAVRMR
jgi:hypothetical protein